MNWCERTRPGQTVYQLATRFSIHRETVAKHLHQEGVVMRFGGDERGAGRGCHAAVRARMDTAAAVGAVRVLTGRRSGGRCSRLRSGCGKDGSGRRTLSRSVVHLAKALTAAQTIIAAAARGDADSLPG